ncbi:MAG TPA: VIT domain-containing protein [Kutzneria sp.]|nr:VIT domain-containing protein [Kutzneria sp.]
MHLTKDDDRPTEDAGIAVLRTGRGNLPLDELDLTATITGLTVRTELAQGFRNPFDEPLEATYIFPLPDRAAVTTLRMEADGRVVEGILKERGEARADYDQALSEGKRASIAEEDRPGVFTMRVGNIMPGERVTVRVGLAGRLPYEDGEATFRFPLVVAPRYIPGTPLAGPQVGDGTALDTDAVPDASRISPPVLLPGFPNPVRLSAVVDIDPAGLPLTDISSTLPVVSEPVDGAAQRLRLTPGERLDRDFVLRLKLGDEAAVTTSLATRPDAEGGTFLLTVLPPVTSTPPRPRDVALVLDRSGSMAGWKMTAARRAAARIVDTLTPADRFVVLAFDHMVGTSPELPEGLVNATDRNRFRAVRHLSALTARGGTEMLPALQLAAATLAGDEDRERVLVLVTDGQVGNEDQILQSLGSIRVHTIGIDTAVNAAFLRRLATRTGGRCELVESEDRLDEAMRHIHHRIGTPLVTDLAVRSAGLQVDERSLTPARLPDLFAGAPVVISGRYTGDSAGAVRVEGRGWQTTVSAVPSENDSLPATWARARIRDLEDSYVSQDSGQADLEREIVDVSLRYHVLSRFTAFVAVDPRVVNESGVQHHVVQPVETPHGWAASAMVGRGFGAAPGGFPTPGGFAPPPAPAMPAAPMASKRLLRSAPEKATLPETVATYVAAVLKRLSRLIPRPEAERLAHLATLAADIDRRLDGFRAAGLSEPAVRQLRDLVTELRESTALDHRWQRAVDVFEALAEQRRDSFWKR